MKHCQDGILVYFGTETQEYDCYGIGQCYGYYEIQQTYVNGKPYFKMGIWAIWFSGHWVISLDQYKPTSVALAFFKSEAFCPSKIQDQSEWAKLNDAGWVDGKEDILITCKYRS